MQVFKIGHSFFELPANGFESNVRHGCRQSAIKVSIWARASSALGFCTASISR